MNRIQGSLVGMLATSAFMITSLVTSSDAIAQCVAGPPDNALNVPETTVRDLSLHGDLLGVTSYDPTGIATWDLQVFRHDGVMWNAEFGTSGDGWRMPSVAVHGSRFLATKPRTDRRAIVQVFHHDGIACQREATLRPTDASGQFFGVELELVAERAAVLDRAPHEVYVFRRDASVWTLETVIRPSADVVTDIALSGTVLAVLQDGEVVLHRRSGDQWQEDVQTIALSDSVSAVDLCGDRLAMGLATADGGATNAGQAVIYADVAGSFELEQRFQSPNPTSGGGFGSDVSLTEREFAVGSRESNSPAVVYRTAEPGAHFRRVQEIRLDSPFGPIAVQAERVILGFRSSSGFATVEEYLTPKLRLTANPNDPSVGDELGLCTCGGVGSGNAALFLLTDVPPFAIRVALSRFERSGRWSLAGTVPPTLQGLALPFVTIGEYDTGEFAMSNVETVRIN